MDLTNNKTLRVLQDIVRLACKLQIKVITCASAGCPWRHVNAAKGIKTGEVALAGELINDQERRQTMPNDAHSRRRLRLGVARAVRHLERLEGRRADKESKRIHHNSFVCYRAA